MKTPAVLWCAIRTAPRKNGRGGSNKRITPKIRDESDLINLVSMLAEFRNLTCIEIGKNRFELVKPYSKGEAMAKKTRAELIYDSVDLELKNTELKRQLEEAQNKLNQIESYLKAQVEKGSWGDQASFIRIITEVLNLIRPELRGKW